LIDNVAAVEAAEASIDQFIEKRARDKAAANKEEEAWAASERKVRAKRREENRIAWIDYFGRMHHAHLGIAEDHARRRAQLLAERGYEPEEKEGEIKNG
jgi:hypothetical protein